MGKVTIDDIKALRKQTGVAIKDAKMVLEDADGDMQKAIDLLRKRGAKIAAKKADREAAEGLIEAYIHGNGKIGVLVQLNCETDFVAKNESFKELAHDIAMHVAAVDPQYLRPEDITEEDLEREKEIFKEQMKKEGKPDNIIEKIMEGKLKKVKEEGALLAQKFFKNDAITVEERINEAVAKLGEKIEVAKFVRYQIKK